MKSKFVDYLFTKKYLIAEDISTSINSSDYNRVVTLMILSREYGILIDKGEELVNLDLLRYVQEKLDIDIPEPFYRNFPMSVKLSTVGERILDQLVHYTSTYGLGNFDEAGHSLFEAEVERVALKESIVPTHYSIVTEEEAENLLNDYIRDLLLSSRPLSLDQYDLVLEWIGDHGEDISNLIIGSKSTAIKLLLDTRNVAFARYISVSDILKLVEELLDHDYTSSYRFYAKDSKLNNLNLRNKDRKFITTLLDKKLEFVTYSDIRTCSERKKLWAGLLHHIHYKVKSKEGIEFVSTMRGCVNVSVPAEIEGLIKNNCIKLAVKVALEEKGSGYVLRNLTYFLSRCKSKEDVQFITEHLFTKNTNPIIILQLLSSFKAQLDDPCPEQRTFTFIKHNILKSHTETVNEVSARKSIISDDVKKFMVDYLESYLIEYYRSKKSIGKVYIDPELENITLPIFMTASDSGTGVLPTGSRLKIADTNIRAFTYWELVNDIDLSSFLINKDSSITEISWRTAWDKSPLKGIVFSGDQTSGYHGGSEYFDIEIDKIKKYYPTAKYIVFCDNVYSGKPFNKCMCKAGYMLRKDLDAGNVYEPKTVKTSFVINSSSTMAYLFAIDLESNELIWLNLKREGMYRIAGSSADIKEILKYINIGNFLNYKWFFSCAGEISDKPEDANIIVSDNISEISEEQELIRGCDFEKLLHYIN